MILFFMLCITRIVTFKLIHRLLLLNVKICKNMLLALHHIRYAVANVEDFSKFLSQKMGFTVNATRIEPGKGNLQNIAMRNGQVQFVIGKRLQCQDGQSFNDFCSSNSDYVTDTVCDVCFSCDNISAVLNRVKEFDETAIKINLTKIQCNEGCLSYAVIKAPMGNIQHTLLDLSQYTGRFLPGFTVHNLDSKVQAHLTLVDHVAFALDYNRTDSVIKWYKHCLGFDRIFVNFDDDLEKGFVVSDGKQGLKLKAISQIVKDGAKQEIFDTEHVTNMTKFVFGESLETCSAQDQITQFLSNHGGEGVQHIAFGTNNILEAMSQFNDWGLECLSPPDNYYLEASKINEIKALKLNWRSLKENNILVDGKLSAVEYSRSNHDHITEVSVKQTNVAADSGSFVMQTFTRPVFKQQTIFFEVIQRVGCVNGFGAGNISALWHAVALSLE